MIRSNRVIQGMLLALSIGAAGIACGGGGGSDDSEKDDGARDAPAGKRDAGNDDVGDDEADDARDPAGRALDAGRTRDAAVTDDVDLDVERGDGGVTPNDGADGEGQTPPAGGRDGGTVASANSCNRSSCDQFITQVTADMPDLREIVKSCCVSAAVCGYSVVAPGAPAAECLTNEQIAAMAGDDLQTSTAR